MTTELFKTISSQFYIQVIIAIIILLIGFIIGRILGRITQKILKEIELNKILKRAHVNLALEQTLGHVVTYFVYFVTIITALKQLDLQTLVFDLIAIAALIVIIISILLAIKDFIPNAISGFMIYQKGIIKEGDKIKIGDLEGKVKKISILETEIETKKGDTIHIPNSNITKKEVIVKK